MYRLCPEVVFCFDGDEAGRKAAFRALEAALPCMEDGRQARFLFLPEGEDPDTAVRGGGAGHFQDLIAAATPLETFLFEALAEGIDTRSMDGRARLSKRVLPYIRQLPEGVYRQLMMQALAKRTGLELASLQQLEAPPIPAPETGPSSGPAQAGAGAPPGPLTEAPRPPEEPGPRRKALAAIPHGFANLAQAAIALLLHRPDMGQMAEARYLAELEGDDVALLRELLALLQRRPDSSTAMLLGHWYGTPEGELLGRLAGQERLIPSEGIELQFLDTMAVLSQLPQRSKLAAQVDKLKLTNYSEMSELDKQRLRELLLQKQQLDQERNRRR